jgi:glutathione S-transferase
LAFLDAHLTGREFLLDRFSVADAYLFTVLNWHVATPVELEKVAGGARLLHAAEVPPEYRSCPVRGALALRRRNKTPQGRLILRA